LSPFPRLLSNVVQQPAIYALGTAGIVATLRRSSTRATANAGSIDRPTIARTIAWVSVSLVAGIFVIGKAYDQYYALLLPLLAVLGGVFADPIVRWSIDAAEPALHLPQKRGTVCAAAAIGIAAWSLVVSARAFKPIAAQIDDIAYVNAATRPSDMYVGGSPGAALFRPHAWYYFFLTGPFAGSRDYGNLLAALEQGRIEPRIVIRDRYLEQRATPALLAYIDSRYRHVRGDIYLRQSEYGSASLKTSDASERFDRPLTR
jgi:hypothetical protein